LTKKIIILGSTGSIGQSTLDVIRNQPERFSVVALVANRNIDQLVADAKEFRPQVAVTADDGLYQQLKAKLEGTGIKVAAGSDAVLEAAGLPGDMVMAAIVGTNGLKPTLAAIRAGTPVGLANKECLVSAGDLFMKTAKAANVPVIPVDSEHSAIFQCLEPHNFDQIDQITLTASGGPFRQFTRAQMATITRDQALNHPNWDMGPKVTIDSSTLMNKGLELIEAYHLFPVGLDKLTTLVHPQSIIHSFVSYVDGSVLAQLGAPDMRTPIAHAMVWPGRVEAPVERLDLAKIATLTFQEVDTERFPALLLARQSLEKGGNAPTILNAANEIAVAEFLSQRIDYVSIPRLVEETLSQAEQSGMSGQITSLDDVWEADSFARQVASDLAQNLQANAS
jgi:1-deoxy-D-xylulose-5-phosphate reductoisomerase